MQVHDEKITKNSTSEQNMELAGLLEGKWANRKILSIVRDKRQDGEYWVLVDST